jgi:hypothetical protein
MRRQPIVSNSIVAITGILFMAFSPFNRRLALIGSVSRLGEALAMIYGEVTVLSLIDLAREYASGGFSLVAGGAILVMFLLSVFIFRVALPLTPQAVLENPMPPITLYLLAALGELLLLPAALGLYLSGHGLWSRA